ncbi:hypothetical protein EI982_14575 [Haloplanus rallus]|uniref:Uncharacterized protein n=1 Tax=Haloplanus rallus TaxID=1816183 RepID=A0A6B9F8N0_9EURY|nr:hypothetical protein [Haloplanus rallus]QGX95922.1 hypothetical protein EI982_14575 [Haloplanus rallus]
MSQASDTETYFEGYSDYQSVSKDIGQAVRDAIDAYAYIDGRHSQGARVRATNAASAYRRILGAAIRLLPELKRDAETKDELGEIYTDWTGDGNDDDGHIDQLQALSFQSPPPDWLFEFVVQIREAAWELGYLQAGRSRKAEQGDPVEKEANSMFRE